MRNTLQQTCTALKVSLLTIFFWVVALQTHAQTVELKNPLSSSLDTIPKFIEAVLKVVVMVALPIITLFFVYAGFKFIMAQGNSTKLQEARMNLLYSVIGAILILGAWVIATLIGGTVTQLVKPS